MAHAENRIVIDRPAKEVFDFLLDGANNPKWRTGILDIQRKPGTPPGVGAAFTQGMKGPTGRIDADYVVRECVPGSLIRFEVTAGPARPTGVFALEKKGTSTEVTFTLDFQPKGLAKLMDPMIAKQMRVEVAALEGLKKHLEGGASRP
jgi:uncharacterized protein YndB with AHSA1/START domain